MDNSSNICGHITSIVYGSLETGGGSTCPHAQMSPSLLAVKFKMLITIFTFLSVSFKSVQIPDQHSKPFYHSTIF